MGDPQEHNMLPHDALRCLWMDAGLVDFKLCDRSFQCDDCPFEARVRREAAQTGENDERRTQVSPANESFREYFEKQVDKLLDPFNNLDLPDDRMYSTNHTWFKRSGGEFTVGIDHCAIRLLGPISTVVLPQTPLKARATSPCVWFVQQDGAIALHTPLAGAITAINDKAKEDPSLVTHSPYTTGWILKLQPEDYPADVLLSARDVRTYFYRQSTALRKEIIHEFAGLSSNVGSTMADGGTHLLSVQDMLGGRTYLNLIAPLFAFHPA